MCRRSATVLIFAAVFGALGCGPAQEHFVPPVAAPTPVTPNTPRTQPGSFTDSTINDVPTPTISTLSPSTAKLGSDVTLTITGTGFLFATPRRYATFVVWHRTNLPPTHEDAGTALRTRVISDTQLTAVLPASLLATAAATNSVRVVNGDGMGFSDGVSYPESNLVSFDVTPAP